MHPEFFLNSQPILSARLRPFSSLSAAARVNGFPEGYRSPAMLDDIIGKLGLSPDAQQKLEKQRGRHWKRQQGCFLSAFLETPAAHCLSSCPEDRLTICREWIVELSCKRETNPTMGRYPPVEDLKDRRKINRSSPLGKANFYHTSISNPTLSLPFGRGGNTREGFPGK